MASAPLRVAADNFGQIRYDRQTDQLFITMLYRGTVPGHQFSLNWGGCQIGSEDGGSQVAADVLDGQFNDRAEKGFKETFAVSLKDFPCARPAALTLRTAPHFFYTLTIPK